LEPEAVRMIMCMDVKEDHYEEQRKQKIKDNRQMLIELGLLSDLGEFADDSAHYQKMMAMDPLPPSAPLGLIVIPFVEDLLGIQIYTYRRLIKSLVLSSYENLCPSGMLAIGVRDVRDTNGILWPLGMLLLEDIAEVIPDTKLKLKELVCCVPDGYARNPSDPSSYEGYVEHCALDGPVSVLPIVHVMSFGSGDVCRFTTWCTCASLNKQSQSNFNHSSKSDLPCWIGTLMKPIDIQCKSGFLDCYRAGPISAHTECSTQKHNQAPPSCLEACQGQRQLGRIHKKSQDGEHCTCHPTNDMPELLLTC
jgi:hypothetical protein